MLNSGVGHKITNAVLFQGIWFAAIFFDWQYALPLLLLLVAHFMYEWRRFGDAASVRKDLVIVPVVAMLGIAFDAAYGLLGIFVFNPDHERLFSNGEPLWLACLWLGFSMTLTRSLSWLSTRGMWFVLLCSVVGPLSYLSGRAVGVVDFSNESIWAVVVQWFCVGLVSVVVLTERLPALAFARGKE